LAYCSSASALRAASRFQLRHAAAQVLAGLAQLRQGRRVAVDEAARAAGPVDRAPQDDGVRIAFESRVADESLQRLVALEFKFGRQFRALGTIAHQRRVAASANQQFDGIHQDGFARTGLPREHGEAGGGLELDALDDDEVPDA
jgi:hypothetical protein